MAILIAPPADTEPILTEEQVKAARALRQSNNRANRVKANIVDTTALIVDNIVDGLNAIWNYHTPQAVLDALGTDAVEAFAFSRETSEYVVAQITGKRDDLVALIAKAQLNVLPYTENADGTITITPADAKS